MQNNQEIYESLLPLAVKRAVDEGYACKGVKESGPLEINCFSICFWIDFLEDYDSNGVYVKIPKIILYDSQKQNILPLSSGDKALAKNEYDSLVYLSKHWQNDDLAVWFVKPLGFIEAFNAIITKRFYAGHFFKLYRKQDTNRKFSIFKKTDAVSEAMCRLGKALARFHSQTQSGTFEFQADGVLNKIRGYASELQTYGVKARYFDKAIRRLEKFTGFSETTPAAINLKGFDIRQVFIDEADGLHLLDPGKMKIGFREVDLARFIVTCRILYWGSPLIFLHLTPSSVYEEQFLFGYLGEKPKVGKILRLLIIKELFKHWRMASFILDKRQWSDKKKRFLAKTYMDPFYKRQINIELSKLECE
jgi:hypothetical protein